MYLWQVTSEIISVFMGVHTHTHTHTHRVESSFYLVAKDCSLLCLMGQSQCTFPISCEVEVGPAPQNSVFFKPESLGSIQNLICVKKVGWEQSTENIDTKEEQKLWNGENQSLMKYGVWQLICFTRGAQIFQNSRHHKGDMKQVLYWGPFKYWVP
jgi:hypothetical protein